MREHKGDWRDLLAAHSLAVDAKKLWLGFIAALATVSLMAIMATAHGRLSGSAELGSLGVFQGEGSLIYRIIIGQYLMSFLELIPLLNPFAGGVQHFALSLLFYILALSIWTFCGGAITRLTALQYARDDIPTLHDGVDMVRKKRKAYYFAPMTPLFGIVFFAVCNIIAGLVGSIPYVGPWILLIVSPLVGIATLIIAFILVLGVLTFGLMLPAVSIGGKDAFEGWSSAYSYLLWGFNRFVGYGVMLLVIGGLTTLAAIGLVELFILIMGETVSIGLIGNEIIHIAGKGRGLIPALYPTTQGGVGLTVASWVVVVIALLARFLVAAYAFSYFFTASTIMCFLLRKHVDRIDVDEVYEEEAEEEELSFEEEPVPTAEEEAGPGEEEGVAEVETGAEPEAGEGGEPVEEETEEPPEETPAEAETAETEAEAPEEEEESEAESAESEVEAEEHGETKEEESEEKEQ